jgi:hypothetical protein
MEAGIGKSLQPVGEDGTPDPRPVIFSVPANLGSAQNGDKAQGGSTGEYVSSLSTHPETRGHGPWLALG